MHARQRARLRVVDPEDARVRVRAAQHLRVQQPRRLEVGGEAGLPFTSRSASTLRAECATTVVAGTSDEAITVTSGSAGSSPRSSAAARRTPSTVFTYAPSRSRMPESASRIVASSGSGSALEQRLRREDDGAGRVAGLDRARVDQGLLDRVQLSGRRLDALGGRHLVPVSLRGEEHLGRDEAAVEQHGRGAGPAAAEPSGRSSNRRGEAATSRVSPGAHSNVRSAPLSVSRISIYCTSSSARAARVSASDCRYSDEPRKSPGGSSSPSASGSTSTGLAATPRQREPHRARAGDGPAREGGDDRAVGARAARAGPGADSAGHDLDRDDEVAAGKVRRLDRERHLPACGREERGHRVRAARRRARCRARPARRSRRRSRRHGACSGARGARPPVRQWAPPGAPPAPAASPSRRSGATGPRPRCGPARAPAGRRPSPAPAPVSH